MGIQNFIGDITSNVGQSIQGFLDSAWSAVSGIGERVGTFVANIWDGGFAGVSNYDGLKTAISNYSKDVQDIVNQYQPDADISDSFQGQSAEALHEFVTSTKSLLDAYVALVEKWNTELDTYYEKYQSGDTTLSNNVSSDAQDVADAASKVSIG